MTPDSKLVSLQEEERAYRETQREQHVKMEAVILPETKECQEIPDTGRRKEGFPSRGFGGNWHNDFGLLASGIVRNTFILS